MSYLSIVNSNQKRNQFSGTSLEKQIGAARGILRSYLKTANENKKTTFKKIKSVQSQPFSYCCHFLRCVGCPRRYRKALYIKMHTICTIIFVTMNKNISFFQRESTIIVNLHVQFILVFQKHFQSILLAPYITLIHGLARVCSPVCFSKWVGN